MHALVRAALSLLLGVPARTQPACRVELVPPLDPQSWEVRVAVAGRQVSLGDADALPDQVIVYPRGRDAVLVTYAGQNEHGPHGASALWAIRCEAGAKKWFSPEGNCRSQVEW